MSTQENTNLFVEAFENSGLNFMNFAATMQMTYNRAKNLSSRSPQELLHKMSISEAQRLSEFLNTDLNSLFDSLIDVG